MSKEIIRSVIDRVLWTAGATEWNRDLLTDAISEALAAAPQVVADERKPFAFVIVDKDRNPQFVAPDWNSAQEHINDACEMSIENAGKWKAIPAFEMRPTDDKLWDETMKDRDQYQEWADKLAEAIALHFGADIGEHSNMNCPWAEALEIIEQVAPVQAQEPVCPDCDGRGCNYSESAYGGDGFMQPPDPPTQERCEVCDGSGKAPSDSELIAPVQPVAMPDGWIVTMSNGPDKSVFTRSRFMTVKRDAEVCAQQWRKQWPHWHIAVVGYFAAPAVQGDGEPEALLYAALNTQGRIVYSHESYENVDMNRRYIKTPTTIVGLAAIAAKAAS